MIILVVMGICMINDHLGGMIIIMDLDYHYCGHKHGHHGNGQGYHVRGQGVHGNNSQEHDGHAKRC